MGTIARRNEFEKAVQMTRAVIREDLGLHQAENQLDNLGEDIQAWLLHRGSAKVYIVLTMGPETSFLQVFSPVFNIAGAPPEGLFQFLLERNQEMVSAGFALKDQRVVLKSDRTLAGLDRSEIWDCILRVGRLADKYDDLLAEQFAR